MKQSISKLLWVLLFWAGLSACQKDAPMDTQSPVQFKFEGTIDGQAVLFEAGEKNYFLNTNYADNGINDVLLMSGTFENKADPTADFLRFDFYGYDSARNNAILQNVFSNTDFVSFSQDSLLQNTSNLVIQFKTIFATGAINTWDFGDGSPTVTGDSVVHTYSSNLPFVNVKLTTNNVLQGCTETVTNVMNLDDLTSQVQFNISAPSTDSFVFSSITAANFNNFVWRIDSLIFAQVPSGMAVSTTLNDSLPHQVELIATGPLLNSNWKGKIQASAMPCFAAFFFTPISLPSQEVRIRKPFNTAILTYRKNGTLYSSYKNDGTNQSNQVIFTKTDARAYDKNANGQSTISLRGSVNTFLYNVNNLNDSIQIVSSNVSTAVAHP